MVLYPWPNLVWVLLVVPLKESHQEVVLLVLPLRAFLRVVLPVPLKGSHRVAILVVPRAPLLECLPMARNITQECPCLRVEGILLRECQVIIQECILECIRIHTECTHTTPECRCLWDHHHHHLMVSSPRLVQMVE